MSTVRASSGRPPKRRVTVYHVETLAHDVILANGAAAETFVDVVTRCRFDNFFEYLELYGTERVIPELQVPRISSRRMLPAKLRRRLEISGSEPNRMAPHSA